MQFPLFKNHLDLAHQYWKLLLRPGDIAIDATCGNGNDSLFISKQILLQGQTEGMGELFLFDIQQTALNKALELLSLHLDTQQLSRIRPFLSCHSIFPDVIREATVALAAYNLGYLPGGDKSLTTRVSSSLVSLQNVLSLIKPGGVVSVTCYPGHSEGQREEEAILKWASALPPYTWNCCHHKWINSVQAPSLLILQKRVISTLVSENIR
jgi:hypothetical protein